MRHERELGLRALQVAERRAVAERARRASHLWNGARRQNQHVPHATWKQPRTRSPTATPVTASPAATTSPTYSWPIVNPGSIWTRPW